MKLIIRSLTILALVSIVACSKEEPQPEPVKTATPAILKMQVDSINNAKEALSVSKQVDQTIQDSAAQQREAIEKTQQ